MNSKTRFLLYVVILNVVRYLVGIPIELASVGSRMEGVMALYPNCFNADFGANDFVISLLYNFVMWFAVVLTFHLTHPVFSGPVIWKSLKVFGLMLLFYLGLSAVYMNHYADELKSFYLWAMLDGAILFLIVGLANGLLYRFFFKPRNAHFDPPPPVGKRPEASPTRFPVSPGKGPGQETLRETGKLPTSSPKSSAPKSSAKASL